MSCCSLFCYNYTNAACLVMLMYMLCSTMSYCTTVAHLVNTTSMSCILPVVSGIVIQYGFVVRFQTELMCRIEKKLEILVEEKRLLDEEIAENVLLGDEVSQN